MSTKTDHLSLTLPANGEYVDSWEQPINENFELVDDNAKAVKEDLVGASGATTDLGGSIGDLLGRLAVGINTDGTLKSDQIDLGANEDYHILKDSKVFARSSASIPADTPAENILKIRHRLDQAEIELARLRMGTTTNRFGTALDPEAVSGAALASAYHGGQSVTELVLADRGFTPNCVVSGPGNVGPPYVPTHLDPSSVGDSLLVIDGTSEPIIYNIDGYLFRIDTLLQIDVGADGHNLFPSGGTQYVYVSREESDYIAGNYFKYYGSTFTATADIDPRKVPTHESQREASPTDPSDGSITADAATFTSATAQFQTFDVKDGDILVIAGSPDSTVAGEYVIKGVNSETELSMYSTFAASLSSLGFYIKRPTIPTFTFSPTLAHSDGKVCIGQITIDASNDITAVVPFAYNGIYDTGWIDCNLFTYSAAVHYLGVAPSKFDLILKKKAGNQDVFYNPQIRVYTESIDNEIGGPFAVGATWMDGISLSATATTFTVTNLDVLGTGAMFYADGTFIDNTATGYQLRAILRR